MKINTPNPDMRLPPTFEDLLAEIRLPLQYHSTVMDGSPTGPTLASKWERSPSLTVTSLSGVEKHGAEYFVVISSFVCCCACLSTCFK